MKTKYIKGAEENQEERIDKEDDEVILQCGWGKCKPNFLQKLLNINWFLLFLSLFSVLQGILVNGLLSASIPHLEREFGFTSTQAGLIPAFNDVSGLLFVLLISYYGGKGHKPKWLGYGAIMTGIGALVFALPKFIKGSYTSGTTPIHYQNFETCHLNNTNIVSSAKCETDVGGSSSVLYLLIFCGAEMIMGLGTTPLYTLGAAYLDENVSPKNSPIYIGTWYIMTFLGPALGFVIGGLVLNKYVDLGKVPGDLHPDSALWVGRWWLPFITLSWVLILVGFVLLMFPRAMPNAASLHKKAIADGEIEASMSKDTEKGLKGFVKATLVLLRNKTLVLVCLAFACKTLVASGLGPFFPKLTTIKFGAKQSETNFMVGLLVVSGTSIGLIGGSLIMRKIKVKGSVKVAAAICAVLSLISVGTSFGFIMPGCETVQIVGVNVNYPASVSESTSLSMTCNQHCNCLKEYYNPLCSNGKTYFSPCFAGCKNETTDNMYTNCSCLQPALNETHLYQFLLVKGKCSQNCKNLKLYLVTMFFLLVIGFLNGTPNNMIVLRSVQPDQRSFAMGLQFLLLRSLAMLPGPVMVGKIIDSTCLVWKYNECGAKSNCAEYDLDQLSLVLACCLSGASAAACILYAIAWKLHKPLENESKNNNNTEKITDSTYENKGYIKDETKV